MAISISKMTKERKSTVSPNIAFSTDSEHQERYVEYVYVYDLSDVDLTQYKVWIFCYERYTYRRKLECFPLESISQ